VPSYPFKPSTLTPAATFVQATGAPRALSFGILKLDFVPAFAAKNTYLVLAGTV
jgi:hypothetical protein